MAVALATMLLAGQATPQLGLPIACEPSRNCWIQKYADVAGGPDRIDYRCGPITTDAHDGIDFRIPSMDVMRRGVPVLAAAAGTVLRVRDGEPDVSVKGSATPQKEAGNGVVIDHGGGWETQYSHLRNGSIRVHPGEKVGAGTPIGLVGLSGNTEYPHLHFSVRHSGAKIDPFSGAALPGACGIRPGRGLWSAAASSKLSYSSGQVVRLDITTAPHEVPLVSGNPQPSRHSNLVAIADVISPRSGDSFRFDLVGPGNKPLASRKEVVSRPYLDWGPYVGAKPPAEGWRPGRYVATFSISRDGHEISRARAEVEIQ